MTRAVVDETQDERDVMMLRGVWEAASEDARLACLKEWRATPMNAESICDRVREAIRALSGLPPPHEVRRYFAGSDAATPSSDNIAPARAWLDEFADTWPDTSEVAE